MYSGRNLFLHVFSQLSCTPAGCAVAFAVRKHRNAKCKAASYFQKYYHPSRGREFAPCCKMARTRHLKESRARLYEQSWQQQVPAQEHSFIPDLRVFSWIGDWQCVKRAHGVVAPHPLRMRKALSSDPSVSTFLCETEIRQWMKSSSVFLEWTGCFVFAARMSSSVASLA